MTDTSDEVLVELHQAGHSIHAIATSTGLARSTVALRLASLGIRERPPPSEPAVSMEHLAEAAQRGWYPAQLARHLGVTPRAVRNAQRRFGIELAAAPRARPARVSWAHEVILEPRPGRLDRLERPAGYRS